MPQFYDFHPPEIKEIHSRSRLFRYFEEKKVVLVEAGPGTGKTAAVADFINTEHKNCVWYRIQRNETDFRVFLERLERGLTSYRKNETARKTVLPTTISHARAAEDFCDRILPKVPEDLYLVLDDFEFVNSSFETCAVVEKLLDLLSRKFRIVLITRETPNLSLARVRSRKELAELKTRDLAFTYDDLFSLSVNLYDLNPSSIIMERLIEITEGWITGLVFLLERVASLSKKEGDFIIENFLIEKSIPEIEDYFQSDLMTILPADISEALIRLSIADSFTPNLIEAVSEKSGFKLIRELQRLNMFISVSEPSSYLFSFNPLFRTYLQQQFEKLDEPQRKSALSAAAEYYIEENLSDKAIKCLCDAGDFEKAKSHMIDIAEELIRNSEYESINEMLAFFPRTMQEDDSYLSYYKAVVNNLTQPETSRRKLLKLLSVFRDAGDYNHEASIYSVLLTNYFFYQTNSARVENIIQLAEEFLESSGDQISADQRELLKALIPLGKWWTGASREEAFEIALRAEETSSRIRNEEAFLCSRLVLAKIYMARGEFADSKELLVKLERNFNEGTSHLFRHYQYLSSFYLGNNYFYCGEISTAISHTRKALQKSGKDFAFRPHLEMNLVLYSLYQDNTEKAENLYEKLRGWESGENLYMLYKLKFLFEMLISYRHRNKRRTEYYRNRLLDKENAALLMTDFPFSYISLSEVSLYTDGPNEGIRIIENLLGQITKEEFPYHYATAMAMLGYMKKITGEAEVSAEAFSAMEELIREKDYTNIDICSPELLKDIAEKSGSKVLSNFPRLKKNKKYEDLSAPGYGMEINTLGSFNVVVHGEEISAELLGGQKRVMDLLKLLIVYRKNGVMKERIYELFWPRYSYKSARDNLNTIIYRLRKLLNDKDEFLSTDINSLRFRENAVITDVDRFLDFIELGEDAEKENNNETAMSMYNSAVELYKGDFLESDLYHDFISEERENIKSRFRNLLFRMIILSFNSADFRAALELAKKLIDADPLCEPGYRMLMIASSAIGNRSEIPRIYSKLNKKLQAYYKVSADEKTTSLRDKLLSGSPPDETMWRHETII